MTTTYGTIPTTTTATTTTTTATLSSTLSRATAEITTHLSTLRPWSQFISPSTFSLPPSFSAVTSRAAVNLPYFRPNYSLLILSAVLLSLVSHPVSLLTFSLLFGAWLLLYFLRHAPLVILGRVVEDNLVLLLLGVATVLFLLLTDVTVNIVVGVVVGVAVSLVHAAARETDELRVGGAEFEDERVGFRGGDRLPLKDTASSGYSS
ncbi:hypothetical protein vseg_000317 [Gypsophila vaccaria]